MAYAPIFNTGDKSQELANVRSVDLQGKLQEADTKRDAPRQLNTALGNAAQVFIGFQEGEKRKQAAQELLKAGEQGVLSYGQTQGLSDEDMGWVGSMIRTAKSTEEGTAKAYKTIDDILVRKQDQREFEAKNKGEGNVLGQRLITFARENPNYTVPELIERADILGVTADDKTFKYLADQAAARSKGHQTARAATNTKISGFVKGTKDVLPVASAVEDVRTPLQNADMETIAGVANSFSAYLNTAASDNPLENLMLIMIREGADKANSVLDELKETFTKEQLQDMADSAYSKEEGPSGKASSLYIKMLKLLRQQLKAMSGATVSAQEEGVYKALAGLNSASPGEAKRIMLDFVNSVGRDANMVIKTNLANFEDHEVRLLERRLDRDNVDILLGAIQSSGPREAVFDPNDPSNRSIPKPKKVDGPSSSQSTTGGPKSKPEDWME